MVNKLTAVYKMCLFIPRQFFIWLFFDSFKTKSNLRKTESNKQKINDNDKMESTVLPSMLLE